MFGIPLRASHSPPSSPISRPLPLEKPRPSPTPAQLERDAESPCVQGGRSWVEKEEVKVEVEDGRILQISGERSKAEEEKKEKWHRVERSSGKFLRRFRLPENAKLDQVKAAMENGVLTVTVPKEEMKKPEVKAIHISS
ncbi:UNVERIFIED_CONTAM: class I heat shock protein [Sesamum latifolium]|uniref:Class I heat shock protein n=1 Tax=Sesamum latifolium TaxID=2727402 RepID=A0AAW2TM31_9LAMI